MGLTMQLPSHVQTNLNKEERLLQRNLVDLDKETRQRMNCLMQDQKIASAKLRSLEARLLASQKKFHALIHVHDDDDDSDDGGSGSELISESGSGMTTVEVKRKKILLHEGEQQEKAKEEKRKKASLRSSLRNGKESTTSHNNRNLSVSFEHGAGAGENSRTAN